MLPGDHPKGDSGRRAVVIEDEEPLARLLAAYLTRAGYVTTTAHDGPGGLAAVQRHNPELVILDLGLPGMDGIEVCRRIRTFSHAYVVMLTARVEENYLLQGLAVGADTYLTKPFSPRSLMAQIAALRRRPHHFVTEPKPETYTWGDLVLDRAAHEVRHLDTVVDLTPTEFDILRALLEQSGKVVTREAILDTVWGPGWVGDSHVIDVHMAHIRRKLADAGATGVISAVRGIGYRLSEGVWAGRSPRAT